MPDTGLCIPRNKMGLLNLKKLYSPVPLQIQDKKMRTRLEVCSSKKMVCPSKSTCCPSPYIGYDCCPLVKGVCCGDFKHCCQFNATCDIKSGQCVDAYNNRSPWVKKMKAKEADYSRVKKIKLLKTFAEICPDRETRCLHHQTCCLKSNGKYECCKFSDGICCANANCCPPGTTCDNSTTGCFADKAHWNRIRKVSKVKFTSETTARLRLTTKLNYNLKSLLNSKVQQVCPGGKYWCPAFTKCSPTTGDEYGCCPMMDAVSCSDHIHCCPWGSRCDLQHNHCVKGGMFTPLFEHLPATKG